jgi:hypothetical protein
MEQETKVYRLHSLARVAFKLSDKYDKLGNKAFSDKFRMRGIRLMADSVRAMMNGEELERRSVEDVCPNRVRRVAGTKR